jgi:hypothetical protein
MMENADGGTIVGTPGVNNVTSYAWVRAGRCRRPLTHACAQVYTWSA